MVYNFSLPPLVVDAFARKDTSYLQEESNRHRQDLLFFDVLATHDGIGLLSAKRILNKTDFNNLLRITKKHNGLISYEVKNGKKEPYELNISYFDAINNPNYPNDPLSVKRFIASQAIMLCVKGVPGIYIHSLLGSKNYYKGVNNSGIKRMINREKLSLDIIDTALSDTHSLRYQVLNSFLNLLDVKKKIISFHPSSMRKIINSDKRLLAIVRKFQDKTVHIIINVSDNTLVLPEHKGKYEAITHSLFDGKIDPYGVYFIE